MIQYHCHLHLQAHSQEKRKTFEHQVVPSLFSAEAAAAERVCSVNDTFPAKQSDTEHQQQTISWPETGNERASRV